MKIRRGQYYSVRMHNNEVSEDSTHLEIDRRWFGQCGIFVLLVEMFKSKEESGSLPLF